MLRSTAVIMLCTLAVPAFAESPSYNYIEGSYQRIELDDIDVDGDGFGIAGSFAFGDMWQVVASYSSADLDFGVDLDEFRIGGGFHAPIAENVDFVANFTYVRLEAEVPGPFGGSADDDGIGASLGLRALPVDRLELAGFVDYVDLDESGDDTSVRGEAWYSLNEQIALGANVGTGDDITRYGIGVRVYFD